MIEASFDGAAARSTAVSGAYQYDTGQRLKMYGLPSPQELEERDDFLSGDTVAVQAQYGFMGDSQTEARIAQWNEMEGAWVAEIPDVYLRRNADVHVYVYVSYGQTETGMRTKTCYEAVFRPTGRPAPGEEVTPDQTNAWDALVTEINLAIMNVNTAASGASAAATAAQEMAERLDGTTAEAMTLEAGQPATAEVIDKAGRKHIVIGVPKGEKGEQGVPGVAKINGHTLSNYENLILTPEDIGALPADHQTVFEFTVNVPQDYWTTGEAPFTQSIYRLTGIKASDSPVVDIDMSGVTAEDADAVEASFGMIHRIETGANAITLTCLRERPIADIPIRLLCVR